MKFVLEIKLGNDEMQSLDDVWEELHNKSKKEWPQTPVEGDEEGTILDRNGNRVGRWYVSE